MYLFFLFFFIFLCNSFKPVLSSHSKRRPKMVFKANYCLMQVKSIAECSKGEHSAIFWTFIELPFVIKIFVLSIIEWPLKTGFTVFSLFKHQSFDLHHSKREYSIVLSFTCFRQMCFGQMCFGIQVKDPVICPHTPPPPPPPKKKNIYIYIYI